MVSGFTYQGVKADIQARDGILCSSGGGAYPAGSVWTMMASSVTSPPPPTGVFGWSQAGYYKDRSPINGTHLHVNTLSYFYEWIQDFNNPAYTAHHYDGGIAGLLPVPGDTHNFEEFRSTATGHHIKVKFGGAEWTAAEGDFDPNIAWSSTALYVIGSAEVNWKESDIFGTDTYRTNFSMFSEWLGCTNCWVNDQWTHIDDNGFCFWDYWHPGTGWTSFQTDTDPIDHQC